MFRTERPELVKTFIRIEDNLYYYDVQPDPIFVDWNTDWTSLLCMIQAQFGSPANELDVYYWDEEDYVCISSQEELEEALRLAEATGCLQLFVKPQTDPFPIGNAEEVCCPLDVGQKKNPLAPGLKCTHSPSSSSMCARVGSLEHVEGNAEETFPQRWSSTQSFSENCQPSELPKAENPNNGSGMAPMQGNKRDAESGVALDQGVALENQTKPEDSNDAYTALTYKMMADNSEGHLSDDEDKDAMQARMMMPGASSGANVIAIEMPEVEHHGTETAEPAEIAETGEMSTKSGRDAETGFWVQQRSETRIEKQNPGKLTERHSIPTSTVPVLVKFPPDTKWCRVTLANFSPTVKKTQLGLRLKGKKNTILRTSEDLAYLQERLMKLHEKKKVSNKSKDVKSSKKHCATENLSSEDSVTDAVRNADSTKIKRAARNSSTTLNSSSPLETVTEASSDTSSLVKKHEPRPSKSEGKKKKHPKEPLTSIASKSEDKMKKHPEEPLTSIAFFDFMCKRAARNSSTTLNRSSPLETVTEASSDTSSLVKKHEPRPSKSEGKKKKHPKEPLTSIASKSEDKKKKHPEEPLTSIASKSEDKMKKHPEEPLTSIASKSEGKKKKHPKEPLTSIASKSEDKMKKHPEEPLTSIASKSEGKMKKHPEEPLTSIASKSEDKMKKHPEEPLTSIASKSEDKMKKHPEEPLTSIASKSEDKMKKHPEEPLTSIASKSEDKMKKHPEEPLTSIASKSEDKMKKHPEEPLTSIASKSEGKMKKHPEEPLTSIASKSEDKMKKHPEEPLTSIASKSEDKMKKHPEEPLTSIASKSEDKMKKHPEEPLTSIASKSEDKMKKHPEEPLTSIASKSEDKMKKHPEEPLTSIASKSEGKMKKHPEEPLTSIASKSEDKMKKHPEEPLTSIASKSEDKMKKHPEEPLTSIASKSEDKMKKHPEEPLTSIASKSEDKMKKHPEEPLTSIASKSEDKMKKHPEEPLTSIASKSEGKMKKHPKEPLTSIASKSEDKMKKHPEEPLTSIASKSEDKMKKHPEEPLTSIASKSEGKMKKHPEEPLTSIASKSEDKMKKHPEEPLTSIASKSEDKMKKHPEEPLTSIASKSEDKMKKHPEEPLTSIASKSEDKMKKHPEEPLTSIASKSEDKMKKHPEEPLTSIASKSEDKMKKHPEEPLTSIASKSEGKMKKHPEEPLTSIASKSEDKMKKHPEEPLTSIASKSEGKMKKHPEEPLTSIASKSEDKMKKHPEEPLTSIAFFDFMCKFEMNMKKDLAKTVAKKTAHSVLRSLPKQGEGSDASSKPPAVSRTGYVHEDIICECCNREIVGTRYICGNCANYDLCEECENIQPSFHDRSHVFIKLRRPCLKAGKRHGVRVPLLKKVIYHPKEEERRVDPERIQAIKECTKGQESQEERHTSRNNNEREEEDYQLKPLQELEKEEEELAQLKEHLKRAQDEADYLADTLSGNPLLSSTAKAEDAKVGEECEDPGKVEIEPGMEPVPTDYELKNVLAGALDLEQCLTPLESPNPDLPATPAGDVYGRVPWDGERTHKLLVPLEILDVDFAGKGDMPLVKPEKEEPTNMLSGCVFWDEEDCAPQDFIVNEDGFAIFPPFPEASSECEVTPASHTEITDATIPPQAEVKLSSDDRTDWQQQETDDVSSFSLAEDSSSDEEFIVILPDCFDVSKPLHLELTDDGPDSDRISLEEDRLSIVHALGSDKEPEGPIQLAGISDGPENEADENDQHTPSADIPSSLSSVPEGNAVGESKEEEDFEEEEHASLQENREADAQQIEEDLAAASEEQLPETQSRSSQTATEEPEDSSLNAEETDVKKLPEPEDEGAAAAAAGDSMDMMTKTIQVASSGLQHLFQTGKDIFRTLQSGDSYECKESTYNYQPSGYTLPKSTWKPSTKEYVPPKSTFTLPKSEFQMPKNSYVAPQHPIMPAASVYTGEYVGALQRIREMGYFNNERILALLRKYDGDIPKVVDELIEETDGDWAQRRHGDRS